MIFCYLYRAAHKSNTKPYIQFKGKTLLKTASGKAEWGCIFLTKKTPDTISIKSQEINILGCWFYAVQLNDEYFSWWDVGDRLS